jgi:hypothetical protein
MVDITVKRRERPEPAPSLARDGRGARWFTTCWRREKTRLVRRETIMRGTWQRCPHCAGSADESE